MLKPIRRHTPTCPHRKKGNAHLKCSCPLWAFGTRNGKRVRESLKTRDLQRAYKLIAAMMATEPTEVKVSLAEAVDQFQKGASWTESTIRKYRRNLASFSAFAKSQGLVNLDEFTGPTIDSYRATRDVELSTWGKELEFLRGFFGYCQAQGWIRGNPAKLSRAPKVREKAIEPYTRQEVVNMLDACDSFGSNHYERRRARAMILLLRHTALRISDVGMMKRSSLKGDSIHVRTIKNSKPVSLPVPSVVVEALNALPDPKGAGPNPEYFFWSGHGTMRSLVRGIDRTLRKIFQKSGVPGAHAHRFRHSLATELLEGGASFEDVASILGSSPAIIRKHYAQWSTKRQTRLISLMYNRVAFNEDTIVTQTQNVSAIC